MTCIEHVGCKNHKGYGQKHHKGKTVQAHRLAYAQANGLDVFDMPGVVMHSCDNPACVNPEHLSLGTAKANTDDMIRKGRSALKFPAEVIAAVRREYIPPTPGTKNGTTGNINHICAKYGISRMQVSLIMRNKLRTEQ